MKILSPTTAVMAFLLAGGSSCFCGDYCSLRIHVQFPNGTPANVPIRVFDGQGNLYSTTQSKDGEAEVCDLGFDLYSIEIGKPNGCDQGLLRNISDKWPQGETVHMIVNICGGDRLLLPRGCQVALRVKTSGGMPAVGAASPELGASTDKYGRLFMIIPPVDNLRFSVNTDGHKAWTGSLSCSAPFAAIKREIQLQTR